MRAAVRAAGKSAVAEPADGEVVSAVAETSSHRDDSLGRNGCAMQTPASHRDAPVEKIESLPQFASARTIALYCSLPDEVPTDEMLRRWLGKKRLALPIIEDYEMTFREYTGEDCLCTGAFGIRTPGSEAVVPPEEIDLMLIPGMAFDAGGRRLGRGKGFYDRYLAQPAAAHIYKVGLCLPHGMVAEVPAEEHDVIMDKIIVND